MPTPFDIIKFSQSSALETAGAFSKMISDSYAAASQGVKEAAQINNNIVASAIDFRRQEVDEWWKTQELQKQEQQLDIQSKSLALQTWYESNTLALHEKELNENLKFKREAEQNKLAHYFLSDASSRISRNLTELKYEINSDEKSIQDQFLILKQANPLDPNDTTHEEVKNNIKMLQNRIEKKKLQYSQTNARYNQVTDAYQKVTMGVADGNDIIKSLPQDILKSLNEPQTTEEPQQATDNKIITPTTNEVQFGDEAADQTGQTSTPSIPVYKSRELNLQTGKNEWTFGGAQSAIAAEGAKHNGMIPYDVAQGVIAQSTKEAQKQYKDVQRYMLKQATYSFAAPYINPKETSNFDRGAISKALSVQYAKYGISPTDIDNVDQTVFITIGPQIQDLKEDSQAERAKKAADIIEKSFIPKPVDTTPKDSQGRGMPTNILNSSGQLILSESGGVSGINYVDPEDIEYDIKDKKKQALWEKVRTKMFSEKNPNELSKESVKMLLELPANVFGIQPTAPPSSFSFNEDSGIREGVARAKENAKTVEKKKIEKINELIKTKNYSEIRALLFRAFSGEFGTFEAG